MYLGRIAEIGPVEAIYGAPAHPYTAALLGSRPSMDPRRRRTVPPLTGDPPNPVDPPSGCRFRTRCPSAEAVCAAGVPPFATLGGGHLAACLMAAPGSGHSRAALAA
jgi:peptide/nickel transport system ATP-binding protein